MITNSSDLSLMEPRSFDEMPQAIQALRERKTVILNLTMMDPDQAQRAVDFAIRSLKIRKIKSKTKSINLFTYDEDFCRKKF